MAPGWGLGAVGFAGADHKDYGHAVTLSHRRVLCSDDAVTLGSVDEIVESFNSWCRSSDGLGAEPKKIYLSVPSLQVASAIATRLATNGIALAGIEAPDLLYGWQPLLTLKEFLASAARPAGLIYTGAYPHVDFLGATP
jgi:hypothetical protein